MRVFMRTAIASALVAACLTTSVHQACAAPIGVFEFTKSVQSTAHPVYWRGRGWGWGAPVAGGLIAGAIIGGALASPYYYGPGYYPGPTYYEPQTVYVAPSGEDVTYCMQRYRSYDPRSGTYLGYDGYRHPCP